MFDYFYARLCDAGSGKKSRSGCLEIIVMAALLSGQPNVVSTSRRSTFSTFSSVSFAITITLSLPYSDFHHGRSSYIFAFADAICSLCCQCRYAIQPCCCCQQLLSHSR